MDERLTPPRHRDIVEFWRNRPEFARAFDNAPACFACCDGQRWTRLERAHLVARCHGGSFWEDNFVLLCRPCHIEQPMLADRSAMIDWVRSHPHFTAPLLAIFRREEEYYGPGLQWTEQDSVQCTRFLRLQMLRFHPHATFMQRFDTLAQAVRQYVKCRELHEKIFRI